MITFGCRLNVIYHDSRPRTYQMINRGALGTATTRARPAVRVTAPSSVKIISTGHKDHQKGDPDEQPARSADTAGTSGTGATQAGATRTGAT